MNAPTDISNLTEVADASPSLTTVNLLMNTQAMTQFSLMAETMASSTVTVPKHLQGKVGDCLAIVMQSAQWGMNPFAVAQKTHVVNGTLGYEAQLVNAVIQNSGAIKGRFSYEYRGAHPNIECRVGAIPAGESTIVWGEWLSEATVTTKNSPLWKTNPKQQLGYLQLKNWARAFAPGAILGVYTADELAEIPPERFMGAADVVLPPENQQILDNAKAEAGKGRNALSAHYKSLTQDARVFLKAYMDELEGITKAAEKRYVETLKENVKNAPPPTAAPAQAPASAPAPAADQAAPAAAKAPTYAEVREALDKATTLDEVDMAATKIPKVANEEHRAELADLYRSISKGFAK